jgi:Phytanoyl-CoA dioxygenase (PhyH)
VGTNGAIDVELLKRLSVGTDGDSNKSVRNSSSLEAFSSSGTLPSSAFSGTQKIKEEGEDGDNSCESESHRHDNEPANLPSLGPPVHVKMKIGDIVLLHPDLAHTGGPNLSYDIRKMLYFRLRCRFGMKQRKDNKKMKKKYVSKQEYEARINAHRREESASTTGDQVQVESNSAEYEHEVESRQDVCEQPAVQWTTWEDVVQAHRVDMFCDLPGVKKIHACTKISDIVSSAL